MEKIPINNFIRAKEVRVIDETGAQLGVMNIFSAIDLAKSKNLDLIQVTEKVDPPVCRIGDYGKYLYSLQKKERKIKVKTKVSKLKEIQIGFNISPHDIEVKAKQAEKFLKEGDKVKIGMMLKGREKAMGEFAKKKIEFFFQTLNNLLPIKTERELKREPKGFTMIISKA
ncbi:MAG: translation initiation factor IF-3 [Candidatus Staskawiczbacteria bacterium RIFCSPHIGHO2_02_FULL_34_10]|uniref:Translation initiation factor IF-3 n=1 Tax=Candidatus Staskawiczbacteria bacterium RIFCSPHIGHO2_02_FULL_34_10 TaxID=1802205 RepID=A0A1G2HZA7_9BACT|nr:MAG: translation initiation factor IF-3 [Candidatus Staskawiczbacteria bacterium RIFCSPHIGHO2_02_FULL_34_10]